MMESQMSKVQVIRNAKGNPAFAVVPWNEYERLRHAASDEDAMLIAAGNAARNDERFPEAVAKRLIAGEPALKVIREWRGLTQAALGEKADVPPQYISQIERAARGLGKRAAKKLAAALGVTIEVLLD
jgi:DNA-binding XRE family transcriptional regulator